MTDLEQPAPTGEEPREPLERPPDPAWVRAARAFAEPLLALLSALLLTALLSLPLLIPGPLAFPLRADPGAEQVMTPVELIERIELSHPALRVEQRLMNGGEHLVLLGAGTDDDPEPAVRRLLAEAGYVETTPIRTAAPDIEQLFDQEPSWVPWLLGIQALVLIGIGVGLTAWRVRPADRWVRSSPGAAIGLGALAGVAALLASSALALLLQLVGVPVEEQAWLLELFARREYWVPAAPWLVLIAPLAEEVFFRGYVYRFVRQELGVAPALVISSVFFSGMHMNPTGILIYLVIGLILAAVYERTGRLVAPIAAHALLNGVVMLSAINGNGLGPG